jgi:hypothetical protein
MAFSLKTNNNLGTGALVSPSGQLASAANFIDPYTYAMEYAPDLALEIHLQKGKGLITKFCSLTGSEKSFASDQVIHTELGDLHEALEGVTVASGDTFTAASAHNLRENDKIIISDGTIEKQAVVSSITSSTVFVAKNVDSGAFGFTNTNVGPVTVTLFSNTWNKGESNFTEGREDSAQFITNYPQIVKDFYSINESDMAHNTWVKAPQFPGGEGWYNLELGRTMNKYDNLIELTHLLSKRAKSDSAATTAGYGAGMKGVVQQIEERGNIANEYITDIEELSTIAFRIKQQGGARSYTVWADHTQMAHFRKMLSGANANYATGSNYGIFNNKKEMALSLDFNSVYIDGVSFHFTPWTVLDDPQLLGSAMFSSTAPACILVPAGEKNVLNEAGNTYSSPYLCIRYRQMDGINRYKKTKFFGGSIGTDHKKDTFEMHIKTEQTNQVVGANQWFVVRRGTGIYTGS